MKKTVFGLEYRSWSWRPYLVKKFTGPVLFYVHNLSATDRKPIVHRFLREIGSRVNGLTVAIADDPANANFEIYVVDRQQYAPVVKKRTSTKAIMPASRGGAWCGWYRAGTASSGPRQ
ncbi:DUF2927 domain-containing protein [Roseibium salinum]|nr:DUF2927 domain-containing protein [Roseibium salinum]